MALGWRVDLERSGEESAPLPGAPQVENLMAANDHGDDKPAAGRIMVVDDEGSALKSLRRILEKEGYQVSTYSNPVRALELLQRKPYDVLLSDLRMPHLDGLELLDRAKLAAPGLEVIIVTGYASLDSAVEATKKGAYHFLAKPFTPDQVRQVVAEALEMKQSREAAGPAQHCGDDAGQGPLIVGKSAQLRKVAEIVARIAGTDCSVLIMGESGTGKELAARSIHAQSRFAKGPFVAFNCAALNAELMENELFGHEKGAFTGAGQTKAGLLEAAQGGTIFLDEIGEMPQAMQVKLLRALQERTVLRVGGTEPVGLAVRVVAATRPGPEGGNAHGSLSPGPVLPPECGEPGFAPPGRSGGRHPAFGLLFPGGFQQADEQGDQGDHARRPGAFERLRLSGQCARTGQYHGARGGPLRP